MAALIYSAIASLDGYTADEKGDFTWAAPDEEVHAFINDLERPIGTYLYGRGMYETMMVWETMDTGPAEPDVIRDFATLWRAADKIVFSTTLPQAPTARTRLERDFRPDAIRDLKATADRDLSIGGPHLAAHALRAGLVDECGIFVVPAVVGGGNRLFPDGLRLRLDLLEERRFAGGMAYLRYRVG
ncbi:dihydrofolate reductase family protein [Nonomuraea jiangxiensis]|uniref:Dihydrofolate reductase n=1 Tax=Nonomuraea jiangxiensis TaxID=633440 RepID=A0A1G9IFN2_9ACTN|nr:dihydrofolate reductase family protein [Nonomuraea jiangxiensis]SDL23997.1 Dihydrofolate reductase [Nonomuraea jiangxiensis]